MPIINIVSAFEIHDILYNIINMVNGNTFLITTKLVSQYQIQMINIFSSSWLVGAKM